MDLTCGEEMMSTTESPGGQQDRGQDFSGRGGLNSSSTGGVGFIQLRIGNCATSSDLPDSVHYASPSETILMNDPRVLQNMLRSEDHNLPTPDYFRMVQKDVTPDMRTTVTTWMFEVCEEEHLPETVFLRAITYVDRFLSIHSIRRTHFQLLGAACLLLSSKWSGSLLSVERLIFYTAHSVTSTMLLDWEMLILSQFKWDMFTITPSDFVEPILHRLPQQHIFSSRMIRDKIKTYTAYCATDYKFCTHPPSMIASACIAAAVGTIVSPEALDDILYTIHTLTTIETTSEEECIQHESALLTGPSSSAAAARATSLTKALSCPPRTSDTSEAARFDLLKSVMEQLRARIQQLILENSQVPGLSPGDRAENNLTEDTMDSGANKLGELEQAETPTDVRDVHF